jgi:hypothetical protein
MPQLVWRAGANFYISWVELARLQQLPRGNVCLDMPKSLQLLDREGYQRSDVEHLVMIV